MKIAFALALLGTALAPASAVSREVTLCVGCTFVVSAHVTVKLRYVI
jgi:hypothetical protein